MSPPNPQNPPSTKPPYDTQLLPILQTFPKQPSLTLTNLQPQRDLLTTASTPSLTITDPSITHEELDIPGSPTSSRRPLKISILRSKKTTSESESESKPKPKPGSEEAFRPTIYHIHGGGMILGSKLFGIHITFPYITQLNAIVISISYRLAPEHPAPAALEDCYSGLCWIVENAERSGVDVEKIMVFGGSAGGGLAAGVSMMWRDRMEGGGGGGGRKRKPRLVGQCLLYPMLDHRMNTISTRQFYEEGTWTGDANRKAWNWYLYGTSSAPNSSSSSSSPSSSKNINIYTIPGLATPKDLRGLPTTWIDVGSAEIFRDEDLAFANRLWEAGVSVELHVWSGAWHCFDLFSPDANVTRAALEARFQWVKRVFEDCKSAFGDTGALGKIPNVL